MNIRREVGERRSASGPDPSFQHLQRPSRTVVNGHEELAGLSTNSSHRTVDGAGHYIHMDRPEAVIEAIREVGDSRPPARDRRLSGLTSCKDLLDNLTGTIQMRL